VFAVAAHPEAPSPAPGVGGNDSAQTGAASSLVPISERRAAARQRKQKKKRARKNASKRSKTERRRRRKSRRSRRKASLSEDSAAAVEASDKPTKRGATSGDGARFEAGKAQLSPALAAAQSLASSESKRQRRRAADSDEGGDGSAARRKRQRRRRRRRNGSDRTLRGASGSSSASGASTSPAHHEQSAHDARESELELRRARRHPATKLVDAEAEMRHEIRSEHSQRSERTRGNAAKGGRDETAASNGDPLVPAKKVSGGGHHGPLNKISSRSRVSGRSKRERRERRGGRQEHMPLAYYAGGKSRSGGKTSVRTQQKRSKAMREQYEEELREEQSAKFERIDRSRSSSQRE
jgi:hypothetical protein